MPRGSLPMPSTAKHTNGTRQLEAIRSPYVCTNCKHRKRACDKKLPSCSYCVKKSYACRYPGAPSRSKDSNLQKPLINEPPIPSKFTGQDEVPLDILGEGIPSDILMIHSVSDHAHLLPLTGFPHKSQFTYDHVMHKRVTRLVQTTGLSLADVQTRFQRGIYTCIPMNTKDYILTFQDSIGSSIPPDAAVSMLVLATTLLAIDGNDKSVPTRLVAQGSFYLATKMSFAQVQGMTSASLPLIQAGILISVFEYLSGRYQQAAISIGACGLMFQACGLDLYESAPNPEAELVRWFIMICERLIRCETPYGGQKFSLLFSNSRASLPSEPNVKEESISPTHSGTRMLRLGNISTSETGLPRTIQAAWLLDRIFIFIELPGDIRDNLSVASDLTRDLQTLLSSSLEVETRRGGCCDCIATVVRAMFVFHKYIISSTQDARDLSEWTAASRVSVNAAAQVMADVAQAHARGEFLGNLDDAALCCRHAAREALDYACDNMETFGSITPSNAKISNMGALRNLIACLAELWRPVDDDDKGTVPCINEGGTVL